MKISHISLCLISLSLLVTGICASESLSSSALDPKSNLNGYILEQLSPHKEAFSLWVPAMINSPSATNKYPQPRLDYINCQACRVVIDLFKLLRKLDIPKYLIQEGAILVCRTLKILKDPLCRKTINHFADTVIRIIDDKTNVTANDFCGIINYKCGNVNPNLTDWQITINSTKPSVPIVPLLNDSTPSVKIMQLTDVHLDLYYIEGSDAECGQAAGCCHEGNGTGSGRAGKYGHFACSMAQTALDSLFDHAKSTHDPLKYIFLTGDYVHSAVWDNSIGGNTRHIAYVTTQLKNTFQDTPIYPVVGNHEANVCNNFPPESLWSQGFDLSWLYKLFSEPFMKYIPADQLPTIRRGGYYTVRPDLAEPVRIIVLNTNLCYLLNFWLVYDTIDPTGQLQWFADTLLAAEDAGEVVYVVGHIPPGNEDCWPVWSGWFEKIVNRFENIILGQFYGHIHKEYFILTFDEDRPISVQYPGPSGVPSDGHSAYKIFLVDGARGTDSTWEIMDHETWFMNLTSSNENEVADWSKLQSAKDRFGLASLRPEALYDFVLRMVDDENLFKSYLTIYNKASPGAPECQDSICKGRYLCELVSSNSGDETQCEKIRALLPTPPTTEPPSVPTTAPAEVTTNPPERTTNPPEGTTNPPEGTTNPPEGTTNRSEESTTRKGGDNNSGAGTNIMHLALISAALIINY